MKLIAIEEHFLTNEIKNAWKGSLEDDPTLNLHLGEIENRLEDIGANRLNHMDESGVDVQVLSLTSPGLHNLGSNSIHLARQTIDLLEILAEKTKGNLDDEETRLLDAVRHELSTRYASAAGTVS